jgi:hypothetical protein
MMEFDKISEDLFNKIRGRFQEVTIGDEEGNVTNEPAKARFFDFDYKGLGKVSVSVSEDEGLTVIYSKDFMKNETDLTQKQWYDFLKELRVFSKKRMLDFSVRDINKTNLTKRDYKFLANRTGDDTMNESKLYGTARVSYQNVGEARIMIKHTENINQESATGRTQKVGAIYIESADGERFKYPYKHLSGARAMAQHVSEGGKPYDDFGTHITGLSEELAKLRKFKSYMGRSAVMAESLAGYMDVVKERIATVKKTVESLQKPAYYKEAVDAFETPVLEDVPADVRENWIDELTIKQFNEELADVFPYIYKLVSEATKAAELGPEDLMAEADKDPCWKGYKQIGMKKKGGKEVPNCVPEEEQLEAMFDKTMGQFAEAANDCDETCPKSCPDCGGTGDPEKFKAMKANEEKECKDCGCSPCECESTDEGNAYSHAVRKAKMDGKKKGDKVQGPDGDEITIEKDEKTPLGEFILSYYDRETGEFPKGETAVLTMVEKDYGEQFIEPAKAFIEQINQTFEEYQMRTQPQQMDTEEFDDMRRLAGLH